jgi:hypothetical protein
LAVVAPAGTVTEGDCTASNGLLLESATRAPPAGAGPDSATVQVAVCPEPRLGGTHPTFVKVGRGGTNVMVAVREVLL